MTTVPESELLEMVALVDQARSGELNFATCCMDAGEEDFIAWEYDAATSTYTPLLLAVDGDLVRRQLRARRSATCGLDGLPFQLLGAVLQLHGVRMRQRNLRRGSTRVRLWSPQRGGRLLGRSLYRPDLVRRSLQLCGLRRD